MDELVGLTDYDTHPSSFAQEIDEIERQVMTTARADLGVEDPRLTGEGWLMMNRVPLRDRNGNVIDVVGARRDISSRGRFRPWTWNAFFKLLAELERIATPVCG